MHAADSYPRKVTSGSVKTMVEKRCSREKAQGTTLIPAFIWPISIATKNAELADSDPASFIIVLIYIPCLAVRKVQDSAGSCPLLPPEGSLHRSGTKHGIGKSGKGPHSSGGPQRHAQLQPGA